MRRLDERITALLAEGGGDNRDRLIALIYDDLRAIAHRELARHAPGHTLCTTSLVHEAYLKLADLNQVSERGRAYLFGAAASAMRQILVDQARRRARYKRGGDRQRVTLSTGLAADGFAVELLELDDALEKLAAHGPRYAQVVEYRYFGGLSEVETAQALGISERTVKSDWAFARAWLYDALNPAP